MPRILASLIVGLALLSLAGNASAQVSNAALGQAKARLACGAGTVVSSTFLPDGSLQVTCSQTAPAASSAVLGGAGLIAPVNIGLLVVTVGLLIAAGNSTNNTKPAESGEN